MTSTIHKYGRRAPKRARAIPLSRILTGKVPAHPTSADYLATLNGGWQMLGNDVAGDCVAVTWANIRRLITAIAGAEQYPTQDEVWAIYRTQNPDFDPDGDENSNGPGSSADGGMDIQTLLEYLVKTGQILAFARVDPTSADEVKAAIAIFGFVWTGVDVQQANETEFSQQKPWDYHRNSADAGGHSVITGGYGTPGKGALGGDERFITWAEETSFTDSYWSHKVEETWVVILPEHLKHPNVLASVDLTALAAYYRVLTGRPFPAVTPTPAPTPPPSPTPAPDPRLAEAAGLAQQLATLMQPWAPDNTAANGA
ncbi:hypothetical protein [Streptomyces sp. NPDC093223]|uniref:hypothetical protein n=1 Tax=Streptomyces sp. NPDC093223 TaxID=3366033 RepID=UPI00381D4C29